MRTERIVQAGLLQVQPCPASDGPCPLGGLLEAVGCEGDQCPALGHALHNTPQVEPWRGNQRRWANQAAPRAAGSCCFVLPGSTRYSIHLPKSMFVCVRTGAGGLPTVALMMWRSANILSSSTSVADSGGMAPTWAASTVKHSRAGGHHRDELYSNIWLIGRRVHTHSVHFSKEPGAAESGSADVKTRSVREAPAPPPVSSRRLGVAILGRSKKKILPWWMVCTQMTTGIHQAAHT